MPASQETKLDEKDTCGCASPTECMAKPGAKASHCRHVTGFTQMMWCLDCSRERGRCFICGGTFAHEPGPVS